MRRLRLLAWLAGLLAGSAAAQTPGLAVLGRPALPPDFDHLPYVNPDAPKGGDVVFAELGSFDDFNPYILRGTAPIAMTNLWTQPIGGGGTPSAIGHVWESLLVPSADEAAVDYGLLAQTIELAPDRSSIAFDIRPEARFADGAPVLAEDVVWSIETLLAKGKPALRVLLQDVAAVEAAGPRRVVVRFRPGAGRDLPNQVGELPVFPKRWWQGRAFDEPLKEPPLGSGPYRVAAFELGRSVTFERRADWWARDLPIARGTNNFGRVRLDYYGDAQVRFEAFRAGQADLRIEASSRLWATGYDFPAVQRGLVARASIPDRLPTGHVGFAFNTRRPMFADMRVRAAIGQLFDFEWSNATLFYNTYVRSVSYFTNSPYAASGVPQGAELALLEPFRADLPPALFTTPFSPPVSDGSGNNREGFRRALALFKEAGWTLQDRRLVNAAGEQMRFVLLNDDAALERILLPFLQQVQRIGIDAQLRTVDEPQYQHAEDAHDFDMTVFVWPGADVPGTDVVNAWSCAAASADGSNNLPGACAKAIDSLVQRIVQATTLDEATAAGRALDRILMWSWYSIPAWDKPTFDIAWWDRFGQPGIPIRQGVAFDAWWVDPARAAITDAARGAR